MPQIAARALICIYDDRSIIERVVGFVHDLLPEVEPLFLVRYPATRRYLNELGFKCLLISDTVGWEHKLDYQPAAADHPGRRFPVALPAALDLTAVTRFESRLAALQRRPEVAARALADAEQIANRFAALAAWWQPRLVVCWNGYTLPYSVVKAIGKACGAFVLCGERGLVPEALVLDGEGVNAGSYLCGEAWEAIAQRSPTLDQRAWANEYRRRYAAERRTVVSRGTAGSPRDVRRELDLPDDTTVMLCPAQLDEDTNPVLFCPEFPTNASVLEALGQAARAQGKIFVLFKTHPEDLGPRGDYSRHLEGVGRVVDDIGLHDLFDAADVVVTRNSTIGLEGLLLGKPVIALGRALWTEKGFTYDVRSAEELQAALASARRAGKLLPAQDERFLRFLVYLLGRYHYYLDPRQDFERESNQRKLAFLRAGIEHAQPRWPSAPPEADAAWRARLDREVDVASWVGRSDSHYHNLMRTGARRILLVKACQPETLRAAADRFRRDYRDVQVDILCRRMDTRDAPAAAGGRHLLMNHPRSLLRALRTRYDAVIFCVSARSGFPRALRLLAPFFRTPVKLITQEAFDPRLVTTPAGRSKFKPKPHGARGAAPKRPSAAPQPGAAVAATRAAPAAVATKPTPAAASTKAARVSAPAPAPSPPRPPDSAEEAEVRDLRRRLPAKGPYTQEQLLALLSGVGIEIGALHSPARLDPATARVFYIDRLSQPVLWEHYARNVGKERIIRPDLVCDGATLEPFLAASLDFIVARHLLEHLPNPLAALIRWHQVLRPGGLLYLSVPHRQHTFDRTRARTSLEHVLEDYRDPSALRDFEHYLDWARHVNKCSTDEAAFRRATELVQQQYSIHYHVWEPEDIQRLVETSAEMGYRWHLVAVGTGQPEAGVYFLLMKDSRDVTERLEHRAARAHYERTGVPWRLPDPAALRLRGAPPQVSACVVNWNTVDLLRDCLRSLELQLHGASIETIVVDNASSDGSAEMVAQEFPHVTLVANRENLKFARANNQAMMRARGKYVLLVNSDIVALPGAIERMAAYLDDHPDAGMVTCKLVYPDGRPQNSCLNFPTLFTEFSDLTTMQRRHPRSPFWARYTMAGWNHGETRDVEQPMASFVMARREVLDTVGYLDPQFPIYYNDVDWCRRIRNAGWSIVFLADASVIHHRRASTDQLGGWRVVEHHRGKRTFYRKHYGALGYGLMWLMNVAILSRHYVKLRWLRAVARRRKITFAKREQLWETAKLLRVYLGLPLQLQPRLCITSVKHSPDG